MECYNMIIESLDGQIEILTDYSSISIDRQKNGEQVLQFTVYKTPDNEHSYNLVKSDSLLLISDESFVIKMVEEDHYSKSVVAINSFFECVDDYVEDIYPNGLYSIEDALQLAFSTSDWSYLIGDSYPQRAKLEEFGNDNAISMLNKILGAFNSEYEIDSPNKQIIVKRRIGVDTDYQIRNSYNITSINRTVDAKNVKTAVKVFYNMDEFGNYNSSVIYYSPNRNNYRKTKWHEPIYSDVITSEEQAISTARLILKDTPDITFSVEFTTLQDMGYGEDDVKLGNGVFLIDERLGIESEARIVAVREFYKQVNGQAVKDTNASPIITISNIQQTISRTLVQQQKQQAQIERTAVKQKNIYNGCVISKEEGFTTTAENGVKTYQNSTEGIKITVNGENQFFVDPINRQLTLDGRLLITSNQKPLFDGFLDENGGNLKIYDNAGNLNVSIGSNSSLLDTTGGDITIYEDNGNSRARMYVRRGDDSGELNLYNGHSTLPKINLSANVSNGNMILLYDDDDEVQTTLGIARGEIGGSRIITQLLLDAYDRDIKDYINDKVNDLIDYIDEEIDYVISLIPRGD